MVKVFCELVHLVVFFKIKKHEVDAFIVVPLIKLSELCSHECEFLSWMSKHIHHECSHQVKFLIVITIHLVQKWFLSINNFIMWNWKNEVFRKSIKHWECKFFVIVFSEEWIDWNIWKCVIHPTNVPLIVKSKASNKAWFCHHWPCCWFFSNHDCVWIFSENNTIEFS